MIGFGGEVTEKRIVTSRERFTGVLGASAPARILLEASTESEKGGEASGVPGARGHRRRPGVRSDVRYEIKEGEDRQA